MAHLKAAVRDALLAAGATPAVLTKAEELLKPRPKFRMKKEMNKRVCALVAVDGVAVVTKSKVFTIEGYLAVRAQGARTIAHARTFRHGKPKAKAGRKPDGREGTGAPKAEG